MKQKIIESWLAEVSPSTAIVYLSCIRVLARFLGLPDPESTAEALFDEGEAACAERVLSWSISRAADSVSPSTIAVGIAAVRSLMRHAKRVGRISWTCEVPVPRVEPVGDRSGPTVEDVQDMLRTARSHPNPRIAARNAALVALLAGCGLRRAEVLNLDLEHVEAGAVAILATCKGKRGRDRIELPAAVREAVSAWISQHPTGTGPLFVGMHKAARSQGFPRLSPKALVDAISVTAENAGIEKRVRPHGLRHLFTTTALDVSRGAAYRVARLTRHAGDRGVHWYDDKKRAKKVGEQNRLAGRVADQILRHEEPSLIPGWHDYEGPNLFDALLRGGDQ